MHGLNWTGVGDLNPLDDFLERLYFDAILFQTWNSAEKEIMFHSYFRDRKQILMISHKLYSLQNRKKWLKRLKWLFSTLIRLSALLSQQYMRARTCTVFFFLIKVSAVRFLPEIFNIQIPSTKNASFCRISLFTSS